MLFRGPANMRYLVARKGAAGVVLFPLGSGLDMSDEQLLLLARRALGGASP